MKHSGNLDNGLTRRSLTKGVMWSSPLICASGAVPAFAVSKTRNMNQYNYGLYVSASQTDGGTGYGPDDGSRQAFASDLNWDNDKGRPTNCQRFTHGEGDFTPGSNSTTGADGTYSSTSGFWWSAPQDTDGAFIKGSSAQLLPGARFVTTVTITVPAGPHASWTLSNVRINRQPWTKQLTGPLADLRGGRNALAFGGVKGTWTAAPPVITPGPDGTMVFTGVITFRTDSNRAIVRENGRQHYGQVVIMPATVFVPTAYGWTNFTLTSSIDYAQITTTVPRGYENPYPANKPLTLSNDMETTTFIVPC